MSKLMEMTEEQHAVPVGKCIAVVESVFEPDPHAAGRVYKPNNRTLCSIFPEALTSHMLHAGGRKLYSLPPVPKGSYALLRVYDTWTLTRNLQELSAAGDEAFDGDGMQRSPVHCQGVADDLIRIWTQDAPGNASGAKPGVMILAGDEPTQLELDTLNETQTEYFRWLVQKADEYEIVGKLEYITEDHRRALRWLGSEDRKWYRKIAAVNLKRCPACAEEINALATVCRHCATNLIKFYRETGIEVTEDVDPGVFKFQSDMKGRSAVMAGAVATSAPAATSAAAQAAAQPVSPPINPKGR